MTEADARAKCGITQALEVIGGKWTILVIRDLLEGARRFSELEASLTGISPRTLAIRLKELEHDGVLERDCSAGESHPVYRLTAKGRSLSAILDQMRAWGESTGLEQPAA
jgi:DNA-binding HxlR family transcriptional regulator